MQRGLVIAAFLGFTAGVLADAPLAPPSDIVRWSPNRRYCAVADRKRDAVVVYRVEGEHRTELWTVTPWQRSFDITDDGDHLIVCFSGLNLLPLDYRPDWTMLQFYEHGRMIRKWSLRELVPDLGKLKRTVSHYEWGQCVGLDAKGLYEVRTVDRGILRFEVRTGRLVE